MALVNARNTIPQHRFPGQVRLYLIGSTLDRDKRIDGDFTPLGFTSETAELLPGAHQGACAHIHTVTSPAFGAKDSLLPSVT